LGFVGTSADASACVEVAQFTSKIDMTIGGKAMKNKSYRFNENVLLSQHRVAQPASKLHLEVLARKIPKLQPTLESTPFGTRPSVNSKGVSEYAARMEEIQKRLAARQNLAKQEFRRVSRGR
jgi:hypothetical protein